MAEDEIRDPTEDTEVPVETPQIRTYLDKVPFGQRIGQLFASGESIHGIAVTLVQEYECSLEEAHTHIRAVYTSWQETIEKVDIDIIDRKNWHIEMRHALLIKTMDSNPRAALAILESLAELEQVKKDIDAGLGEIPISIELIAQVKKVPVTTENIELVKESTDDNNGQSE